MPELFVTNYNPRYTGVSATAERMAQAHLNRFDLALVGKPLHGLPDPIPPAAARRLSRVPSNGRACAVWHVRRDPEMISVHARGPARRLHPDGQRSHRAAAR